jgi:hypothetical protein
MVSSETSPAAFSSRRDAWLVAVIWTGAALAVAGGFALFNSQAPPVIRVVLPLAFLGGALLMLWILYGTSYVIRDQALLIRNGPFRTTVPLPEVDSVRPSRDPAASPANSLDRLLICWSLGRHQVLISPHAKQDFLRALAQHAPQLSLEGDSLERVDARPTGASSSPQ